MIAMKPVVIAGAGPVGCVIALQLARHEIPVILLEGMPSLEQTLRASTFHPPTLDLLEQLDLTQRLVQQGLIARRYQYRDRRTEEIAEFDLGLLAEDTRHPYRLQVEQWKLTNMIWAELSSHFNEVADCRLQHQVRGAHQNSDGVEVLVSHPGGESVIEASYLIGTDGADSTVRRSLAIPFDGYTYPERFVVASTTYPLETLFHNLAFVSYISDPEEWLVFLRTPSLWRVLIPTDANVEADDFYLTEHWLQERMRRLTPTAVEYDIVHRTVYRVHQRVARHYRRGRVLLAGDAAHINNPLGGLGMNGGIHDAFNLCQRILETLAGHDETQSFELYERQRRTVCVRVIQEQTRINKKLIEEKDPDEQKRRQAFFMATAADPAKAHEFLLKTSMIQSLRDAALIH
jgi:3-(3-hydroxy-phenyl)propionate hydroxylase